MGYSCSLLLPRIWLLLQMQIELVALLPNVLPPAIVFFLASIYCHGLLNVNRFIVPVLKLSIVVLPMMLLKLIASAYEAYIKIDIHFVRDLVAAGQVRVLHVPSLYQYADIFTKGLPSALFEEFRYSLSVRCPPAQTARSVSPYLYCISMHDCIGLKPKV
ncbi:hypothetical protein Tco_0868514 [Tanacetum coccineum]